MTNYLETIIIGIPDEEFQTMISELCECFNWAKAEFKNKTLTNLFTAVVTEKKKWNLQNVLIDRVLAHKVREFASNSVVHGVCCELANRKGKSMDDLSGKSVFMLIKQCHKAVCPPLQRIKKPTRREIERRQRKELILRRRSNGSYF